VCVCARVCVRVCVCVRASGCVACVCVCLHELYNGGSLKGGPRLIVSKYVGDMLTPITVHVIGEMKRN